MTTKIRKYASISATCRCEKSDASFSWGMEDDLNDGSELLEHFQARAKDDEWMDEGISDSFWENSYEFEPGIERVKQMLTEDNTLDVDDAILEVFGHFSITYEFENCPPMELNHYTDVDSVMHNMLSCLL